MQVCSIRSPRTPSCPQPGLFGTAGFPLRLMCAGTGFSCLLSCLPSPPGAVPSAWSSTGGHAEQSLAGAGAPQTSAGGMTVDGGTNKCMVPPHASSPPTDAARRAGVERPRRSVVYVWALAGEVGSRTDPLPQWPGWAGPGEDQTL